MDGLEGYMTGLRERCAGLPGCRTGGNGRYVMADIGLAAFSVFFMQSRCFWPTKRRWECQEFRARPGHRGKKESPTPPRKAPIIPDALLDQLLSGADAKTAFDSNGLLDNLKKALAERVLKTEMEHHLTGADRGGRRNGYGKKTVPTDTGAIEVAIPRHRAGTFDPQLLGKCQRRFPGFDDKIVSMYARGVSTREIAQHLREIYGLDVSADLISTVTDTVIEEVAAWRNRPLETTCALVFLDAIRVKIRDESLVRNKAMQPP